MGKNSIPRSVMDSSIDAIRNHNARVEYLGIYKGYDAYALLYPDNEDVGYPEVYLCNKKGMIVNCLQCEDALDAIESFYNKD